MTSRVIAACDNYSNGQAGTNANQRVSICDSDNRMSCFGTLGFLLATTDESGSDGKVSALFCGFPQVNPKKRLRADSQSRNWHEVCMLIGGLSSLFSKCSQDQ